VVQSGVDADRYSLAVRNTVTRLNANRVNLDLVVDVLRMIDSSEEFAHRSGAVLVFLPGLAHIQMLYQMLEADALLGDSRRYSVFECILDLRSC